MIESLSIRNLRNITSLDMTLSPSINCIYGENGSGKSSILEAMHFLGLGRSFRTRMASRVIAWDADCLTVFAKTHLGAIGINKSSQGATTVKMNNERIQSIATLAAILPLQLMEPHSYRLLEGAPKQRRQLIDWGVFHVEHAFFARWREVQKALKHRNASIRQGRASAQVNVWNADIIRHSEAITSMRKAYLEHYLKVLGEVMQELGCADVNFSYYQGWHAEKALETVLEQGLERDYQLGYTQFGPHRADLKIRVGNVNVVDVLSRGQQKLLVLAMGIAQGLCLHQLTEKKCLYLIDDMAAELDATVCSRLLDYLISIRAQVVVTCVNPDALRGLTSNRSSSYKIDAGKLVPLRDN